MKAKSSVVSEQLHPLRSQSHDNVSNSDGAVPYAITGEFGGIVKIISFYIKFWPIILIGLTKFVRKQN